MVKPSSRNVFDDLRVGLANDDNDSSTDEELSQYLDASRYAVKAGETFCPLQWWQQRVDTYPRLSRMALDYLSIPGELSRQLSWFQLLTYCVSKLD